MLIRFLVANYLSFDQQVEFSMVKGKARQHPHHIIDDTQNSGLQLLRAGLIYGPNAAGKSNLIKAIAFAKKFITQGVAPKRPIDRKPFRLNKQNPLLPSKFEFTFSVPGRAYIYGFELDQERVHHEWLYQLKSSGNTTPLFERTTNVALQTQVTLSRPGNLPHEAYQLLDYAGKRTRYNQLFLSKSIEDERPQFEEVFDWFDTNITLVFPGSQYIPLPVKLQDQAFLTQFEQLLQELDTGIDKISFRKINPDISPDIIQPLQHEMLPNETGVLISEDSRFLVRKSPENELEFLLLVTEHHIPPQGAIESFELSEESDGTRRLMDLLPIFLDLRHSPRLFIVDEIDRSLHPNLSRAILSLFFTNNQPPAGQLILTTHESRLLDLDCLRRDEIWFVEKNSQGASHLYSLEEFVPRYDKDIRKDYLSGRFGAIPILRRTPAGTP